MTEPSGPAPSSVRRVQIIALMVCGVLAGITWILSLVLDGSAGEAMGIAAAVFAGLCAVVGISFAVVGGRRC